LARDELLDDTGGDTADAVGFAAVVAEGELVEIGLQMLVAHRSPVRSEQPAPQGRDRPVAALQRVPLAPLRLGLHVHVVRPLVEALAVIAGEAVRHDVGLDPNLAVGEALLVKQSPPAARVRTADRLRADWAGQKANETRKDQTRCY
jgi:hypothetical protein